MTQLLAESPWLLSLLLAGLALICAIGWLKTGTRGALISSIVFLLLIPLGLYIEQRWVTDREQIRETIQSVADALERGDEQTVIDAIHPVADPLARFVSANLSRVEFEEARVTGYREIKVWPDHTPPEAEADIMVSVAVRTPGASFKTPRRVIVQFLRDGDRWRVSGFENLSIAGKPDQFSNQYFLRP